MLQPGEAAYAVVPVHQQSAGLEVVEAVHAPEGAGGHPRRLFRPGIEDVLTQQQAVVPDEIHPAAKARYQGKKAVPVRSVTQRRHDAVLFGQLQEFVPAAPGGKAQDDLTFLALPLPQARGKLLPRPVRGAGLGEKIGEAVQPPLRQGRALLFHAHDQRFGTDGYLSLPRGLLRIRTQTKGGRLRQIAAFLLQPPVQPQGGLAQVILGVRSAGQQPERILRQPVLQQAGIFMQQARKETGPAAVQGFLETVMLVLAQAALGEQAVQPFAPAQHVRRRAGKGQHRQQAALLQLLEGALTFRVEEADLLDDVPKEFQPQRAGITGGENIQDVAATGHVAGAADQRDAFIAPLHGLLQQ